MHGSSAILRLSGAFFAEPSAMGMLVPLRGASSAFFLSTVWRGVPCSSARACSSSETTSRSRASEARMASSSAIAAVSSSRSRSSSIRENLVSWRSRSSRMYSAWTSLRSKTWTSRRFASAAWSEERMISMTSSMSTSASSRPSTRWSRSFFLPRRKDVRRRTTERRWST